MKRISVALVLVLVVFSATGQQTSLNTLYNQNPYFINPAAAGVSGCFSAYVDHRNQWVGINGSPVRNALTVDARVFKKHGIGLDASFYSAGLLSNFNTKITYAYHLSISEKSTFSAGLSVGIVQQNFAFSDVIASDYSDGVLASGNQSDLGFSSDAGLYFNSPRVRVGVSVPQVFAKGLIVEVNSGSSDFRLVQHMQVHGEFDVVKTENWNLSTSILYKNAAFIGHQFDFGARVLWNDVVGIGAIYRTSYGTIGLVDLRLGNKIKLAYSYGFGGGNATIQSKGSHEILLGIRICRKPVDELEDLSGVGTSDQPEIDTNQVTEAPEPESSVDSTTIIPEQPEPVIATWKIDIDSLNQAFAQEDRLIVYTLNSYETVTSDNDEMLVAMVYQILKDQPDLNLKVIGHTCNIGEESLNVVISEKRAEHIKSELIEAGVDPARITTEGKGEFEPRLPNDSVENQTQNRRVQFIFVWK